VDVCSNNTKEGLINLKTAVEHNYFDDLMSDSAWIRFKTKTKMFFGGYEMKEIRGNHQMKKYESQEILSSSSDEIESNVNASKTLAPDFERFPNREEACIPKDTIIEGSISTKANLLIDGFVRGNVVSENNITITGKVEGNIQAKSIHVNKGTIDGHLNCIGGVQVSEMSIINGNIDSQSLEFNGEIKGDMKISKTVTLKSGAFVDGNIITKSINMQEGAVLRGNVEMPIEN